MAEIAVLLATYNGINYIKELLDSLLSQTYDDFICYIHDDGSKDGTLDFLKNFVSTHSNKFTLLEYAPTGSAAKNFISLMKYVDEPFVMFADQDDVWLNDKIEKTYNVLKKMDNLSAANAVFTDLQVVDSKLSEISPSYYTLENRNPNAIDIKQLLQKNVAAGCTMMINKKLVDLCNSHSKLLELTLHDWGAILLAKIYGNIEFIDIATILYRQHDANAVGAKRKKGFVYILNELKLLFTGKKFKYITESILLEQSLVKEIDKFIENSNSNYNFIHSYADVLKKGKISRIRFYYKNKIMSTSPLKIWRILFV